MDPPPGPRKIVRRASETLTSSGSLITPQLPERPKALPRRSKTVDIIDDSPSDPFSSLSINNPIYCVPQASPSNTAISELPRRFSNCYEEVSADRPCLKLDLSASKQDYYVTVSQPMSLYRDSCDILSNIQFNSPIENNHRSSLGQISQNSSSLSLSEEFNFDPPAYPPPPLPEIDYFDDSFSCSFDLQEFVPPIPPRPQSSVSSNISSGSDGSGSWTIDSKPALPSKNPSSLPLRKAPAPPAESSTRPRLIPPKPPRRSIKPEKNPTEPKIQELFPYTDYLYITGSHFSKQNFLWRWCDLEKTELTFYEDEAAQDSKGEVVLSEVLSLSLAKVKKQDNLPEMFCFTLHVLRGGGKQYLLGATFPSIRYSWMSRLAYGISPTPLKPMLSKLASNDWNQRHEFCRAGFVFIKEGISGQLQQVFLYLQHNLRLLHIANETADSVELLDLRKVINLKVKQVTDASDASSIALQSGSIFYIDYPGRTLYVQSHLKLDTVSWFQALKRCLPSGNGKTLRSLQMTANNVPVIVDKLVQFVSAHGCLLEGIYRLSAQASKIKSLLSKFNTDAQSVHLKPDEVTPQEASNALKQFLRQLDDCLLSSDLYKDWIATSSVLPQNDRLTAYQKLLQQLPETNYCTLKYLIGHLVSISSSANINKMNSPNLAAIFGPSLLFPSSSFEESDMNFAVTNLKMDVINDFINFYSHLFAVDNDQLLKQQKIDSALQKLKSARLSQKPAGDILLGVYIYSLQGRCQSMPIPPLMKASELIKSTVEKAGLEFDYDSFSLFEVICGGELERIIQAGEMVFPVILQWSSWPAKFSKENYLVIKSNSLLSTLKPHLQAPTSLFSEMKYADCKMKSFKKATFEFTGARLSYYKDIKAPSCESFNIEDIHWYMGCQAKRSPPSKFCFTLVRRNLTLNKTKDLAFFGTTVCCQSEDDYHKWLSAMLVAEYPTISKTI